MTPLGQILRYTAIIPTCRDIRLTNIEYQLRKQGPFRGGIQACGFLRQSTLLYLILDEAKALTVNCVPVISVIESRAYLRAGGRQNAGPTSIAVW